MASEAFQPLRLRGLLIPNRVWRAAAFGGGSAAEVAATHAEAARGGMGLSTVAYTSVLASGRKFPAQLLLSDEAGSTSDADLAAIAGAVHAEGMRVAVQLTHGGGFSDRRLAPGGRVIGPSAMFEPATCSFVAEMTVEEARGVAAAFGVAARRAVRAGFDVIELHAGHGYLLSQCLSPALNRRTDGYGGSTANRCRLPLACLAAVRAAVGEAVPVIVKLNVHDGIAGGLEGDEAARVAAAFVAAGADAIVPSCGFVSRNGFYMLRGQVPLLQMAAAAESWALKVLLLLLGRWLVPTHEFREGFLRTRARALLAALPPGTAVGLVGGVTSAATVRQALHDGFAFVQVARAAIRDPDFARKLQRGETPLQCTHCNLCVVATLDPSRAMRCVLSEW